MLNIAVKVWHFCAIMRKGQDKCQLMKSFYTIQSLCVQKYAQAFKNKVLLPINQNWWNLGKKLEIGDTFLLKKQQLTGQNALQQHAHITLS